MKTEQFQNLSEAEEYPLCARLKAFVSRSVRRTIGLRLSAPNTAAIIVPFPTELTSWSRRGVPIHDVCRVLPSSSTRRLRACTAELPRGAKEEDIPVGGSDANTKSARIEELQNALVSSAVPLRDMVGRAKKTYAATDRINGHLLDPVAFPPNPRANQPFSIADALLVHIPKDSTQGTYDIIFGINLLSSVGDVVSKSVLVWPVSPNFGPDFGWSPTAQ